MSRALAFGLIIIAFGLGVGAGVLGILYATGSLDEESEPIEDVAPQLSLDGPTATLSLDALRGTEVAGIRDQIDGLATQFNQAMAAGDATQVAQLAILGTQVAEQSDLFAEQFDAVNNSIASLDFEGAAQDAIAAAFPTPLVTEEAPMPQVTEEVLEPQTTEEALEPQTTEEAIEPQATEEVIEPQATEEVATSSGTGETPTRALYRINPDESEVRFLIDENMRGTDIVVVGSTSRVAGDVIVNFIDPPASQLGEIVINARTLRTDNEFRNQSIRGQILDTTEHEFINFVPTQFVSLTTDPVSVGDTVSFEITGDLTVRGISRSVTFATSVTIDSLEKISGSANTTVLYSDYGISVNPPPGVSGVGDVVTLEIDFVADQVESE